MTLRAFCIALFLSCPVATVIATADQANRTRTRVIRLIQEPDVCDTIITDGKPQQVCTEVIHVR